MGFLIDTNVISELRKGPRADAGVRAWVASQPTNALFLSVLTLGEIVRGVERLRLRDVPAADALDRWQQRLMQEFADRILLIDRGIAARWGTLDAVSPLPSVDGLLAATALEHGLVVATRNTRDFERTGLAMLNPWSAAP